MTLPVTVRSWDTCRVCGGRLAAVLTLGNLAVSAFPKPGEADSLRRQANTVVRLTVVTTFGLIGTVLTGILAVLVAAALLLEPQA
mgnify:CR=1 FL=1